MPIILTTYLKTQRIAIKRVHFPLLSYFTAINKLLNKKSLKNSNQLNNTTLCINKLNVRIYYLFRHTHTHTLAVAMHKQEKRTS